jgi:hypothetical protein
MGAAGEILFVAPRQAQPTQPIVAPVVPAEPPKPYRVTYGNVTVIFYGEESVIILSPKIISVTTHSANTSSLGENEAIIRFHDPTPSSSRGTEIIGK